MGELRSAHTHHQQFLKEQRRYSSDPLQYLTRFEKQLNDSIWTPPRQQLRTSCPSLAITTPPSTRRLPRPSLTRPSTALSTRTSRRRSTKRFTRTTTILPCSLSTTRHSSLSSTTTT